MFHSEMTSLYLGKVDVGVSAGSLVTKYGGLSNCERSIFVRSTVEAGTLSSTTGAAIGWQAPIISSDFKSIKRFKVFKRIGYQAHQISNVFRDCFRYVLGHIGVVGH